MQKFFKDIDRSVESRILQEFMDPWDDPRRSHPLDAEKRKSTPVLVRLLHYDLAAVILNFVDTRGSKNGFRGKPTLLQCQAVVDSRLEDVRSQQHSQRTSRQFVRPHLATVIMQRTKFPGQLIPVYGFGAHGCPFGG